MSHATLQPAMRFDWERIVRRCRLQLKLKAVAYTLAQYGNVKGEGIRPGMARLSAVCEVSDKTARRYVDTLLQLGLIECVSRGGGPQRLASEYRLTVPEDLPDRVELLGPDELADLTPDATPRNQPADDDPDDESQGTAVTQMTGVRDDSPVIQMTGVLPTVPSTSPGTEVAQVTGDPAVDNGSTTPISGHLSDLSPPSDDAAEGAISGHSTRELRSKRDRTPVTQVTAHQETTQTHHPGRSPQTRPSPATAPAVDNPIHSDPARRRPPADDRCEHGQPVRWLDTRRTLPACPDCRRATREAS